MTGDGSDVLDVDLLAFENGDAGARRATIDGVHRSLATGFVYTSHDVSEGLLDDAYAMLELFFSQPADAKAEFVVLNSHGQTGYTGLLVETAATADHADWKEMLNWGRPLAAGHPLALRFPHRFLPPVLPERLVPGITEHSGCSTTGYSIFNVGSYALSPCASAVTRRSSTPCWPMGRP